MANFQLASFGAFLTPPAPYSSRSRSTDYSSRAIDHSPLFRATSFCTFLTTALPEPRAVRSIRGDPGRSASRQAFPISPYPAISHGLQDRQIERISFRVSTNTHRAPPCGLSDARACTAYRIGKEHPHDPDILSLLYDCPTLASVSGKWSLHCQATVILTPS